MQEHRTEPSASPPAEAGKRAILDTKSFIHRRPMSRRSQAFTLLQASEESPTLAGLMARARESQARLAAIAPLLPPALRATVTAGPVEEGEWCLLVDGNAVAAKLRQMVPMLLARLRVQGWDTRGIRIKVRGQR